MRAEEANNCMSECFGIAPTIPKRIASEVAQILFACYIHCMQGFAPMQTASILFFYQPG